MKTDATPDRTSSRLHGHYTEWFVGTGAQTEFFLTHTVGRIEDLEVFVDGAIKRPSLNGTAFDYKIRGHTPGYDGEKNAIKFAVAPVVNKNVCVRIIST